MRLKSLFYCALSDISNTTKCYGILGCLSIDERWFGLARPVNVLPMERQEINTHFVLRTRNSYGVIRTYF